MENDGEIAGLRERLDGICRRHLSPEGADLVIALARPAIRLQRAQAGTRSHLGGVALLDHRDQWPRWNDRPLSLVAVLDLGELSPFTSDLDLPPEGVLNVFYDDVEQPWGFRPEHRGGWRVVLSDPGSAQPVAPPDGVEAFASIGLRPSQTLTIPGPEEPVVEALHPPYEAREAFSSVADAWAAARCGPPMPDHQVGGWPWLIQAPIWEECDMGSRGIPLGTSDEWRRAQPLRDPTREQDWRLLLQLDSDDDAGWMWGDLGTLYFTVRHSLPIPAACDEAWLTLQCT